MQSASAEEVNLEGMVQARDPDSPISDCDRSALSFSGSRGPPAPISLEPAADRIDLPQPRDDDDSPRQEGMLIETLLPFSPLLAMLPIVLLAIVALALEWASIGLSRLMLSRVSNPGGDVEYSDEIDRCKQAEEYTLENKCASLSFFYAACVIMCIAGTFTIILYVAAGALLVLRALKRTDRRNLIIILGVASGVLWGIGVIVMLSSYSSIKSSFSDVLLGSGAELAIAVFVLKIPTAIFVLWVMNRLKKAVDSSKLTENPVPETTCDRDVHALQMEESKNIAEEKPKTANSSWRRTWQTLKPVVLPVVIAINCIFCIAALASEKWCEISFMWFGLTKAYTESDSIDLKELNDWCSDNGMPAGCSNFRTYFATSVVMLIVGISTVVLNVATIVILLLPLLLRKQILNENVAKITLGVGVALWGIGVFVTIAGFARMEKNLSDLKMSDGYGLMFVSLALLLGALAFKLFLCKEEPKKTEEDEIQEGPKEQERRERAESQIGLRGDENLTVIRGSEGEGGDIQARHEEEEEEEEETVPKELKREAGEELQAPFKEPEPQ